MPKVQEVEEKLQDTVDSEIISKIRNILFIRNIVQIISENCCYSGHDERHSCGTFRL